MYFIIYFNSTKVQFGEETTEETQLIPEDFNSTKVQFGVEYVTLKGLVWSDFNSTKVQFGEQQSALRNQDWRISIPLRYNLEAEIDKMYMNFTYFNSTKVQFGVFGFVSL